MTIDKRIFRFIALTMLCVSLTAPPIALVQWLRGEYDTQEQKDKAEKARKEKK